MTSIFNASVVCLLIVLFWSSNEKKLTYCGLFIRASLKEIKREIGNLVRLECGRRSFDVSWLGIVGLHISGYELFILRSFEELMT